MRVRCTILLAVWLVQVGPSLAADAAAAERQYRIARRLVAQGSPEAATALAKVLELDPEGRLADDALTDQALLLPVPRSPDQLGGIGVLDARQARTYLDRVLERFPRSDRALDARYYRALLRLEPLPGHDVSAARLDLTAVIAAPEGSALEAEARYGLAWLYEQEGRDDRAFDAYQRLLVDDVGEAATRARVGIARLLLRQSRFGEAARRLQEAIDDGAPGELLARSLRELAVSRLLQQAGTTRTPEVRRIDTGVRAPAGFAPLPGGGLLLGDRKSGRVFELDRQGVVKATWELPDVQTVAVDARGRRFAAADESVYRLAPGAEPAAVAPLGEFAPLSAMAVDGMGGFWLLDRRGRRIARVDPGADAPGMFWDSYGPRLVSMVWDGRRLVAADAKTRSLLAFDKDGRAGVVSAEPVERPVAVAADPAGRLALLDGRSGTVRWVRADAAAPILPALPPLKLEKPLAVGLGGDGAVHAFDAASGEWVTVR